MRILISLPLLAAVLNAAPALARGEAVAAPDNVVVTAGRAEQSRDELSVPVARLGQVELERIGAHHIAEALNRAPGVNIHRGNGAEHLTAIRSPVLTGGAGAGSFLYLEDGVALRAAGFANVNGLFEAADDLASGIEVVRGPGGAVYGSNALHGLVNVLSRDPSQAGRRIELEAGSFGRARANAFISGATRLGDGFVGGSVRTEDGWREDASLRRGALQARLDGRSGETGWSLRGAFIDLDQETATFVRGFEAYRDEAMSRSNADPEAFRNASASRVSLHVNRPLNDDWTARGVAYARSNDMQFRLHFLPSEALEETGHDSIGFQSMVERNTGRVQIRLGVDGEATRGELIEDQTRPSFGSFPQGLHYDYEVEALVGAIFTQWRWDVSDTVSIDGGARLESTRYDYDTRMPAGQEGRFLRSEDRSDDFTTFAPHLGAVWRATDAQQFFARAARGVRAPQTAELYRLQPGQIIDEIEPETLDSVEMGWRFTGASGVRLELVGFAMTKRNVFFRDADGFNVTDGETTHNGVELDLIWPLTDALSFAASASFAEHDYAFDRLVARSSDIIRDGARVDTAPDTLANARLIWAPVPALQLEAEWVHVGAYFADAANSAEYDGHDLGNLRGRYAFSDGVEVFAALRNVFDERYAERADFAFGSYRYFPGEPRSVSFGVRISG
ncbi:MAG: TonB-dependent receptor [Pseudomonadota bacterium]